jgi:hypothetical protein
LPSAIRGIEPEREKEADVWVKESILLYGCQNLTLGGSFHYCFQFVVWMATWGLSTADKASANHDSLGNRHDDIFPDVVSLLVAQVPQTICATKVVEQAFHAASMDFLSTGLDTGSYRGGAGSLY